MRERPEPIVHAVEDTIHGVHAAGDQRPRAAVPQDVRRLRDRGEPRRLFLADGHVRSAQLHLEAGEARRDVGDGRVEDEGRRARGSEREETAEKFLGRLSARRIRAEHDAHDRRPASRRRAHRHRRAPGARARPRRCRRRPCAAASSAESSAWGRNPRPARRSARGRCWCRTWSAARRRGAPRSAHRGTRPGTYRKGRRCRAQ